MNDYTVAQKVIDVILQDLMQRRGISYELEQIDSLTWNELKQTLVNKAYIAILEEKHKQHE